MIKEKILEKLRLLGTAAISDAKGGVDVFDCELRPRTSDNQLIAGIAETVHVLQKSVSPIRTIFKQIIESKLKNVVLVIDASGLFGAVWGEIFTHIAKKSNVIGCIIDGGIRDLYEIKKAAFPVWARYVTPRVITGEWATTFQDGFELGKHTHIPILCGGVLVRPGDYIIADLDGVVAIRPDEAEEIVKKAEEIRMIESKILESKLE